MVVTTLAAHSAWARAIAARACASCSLVLREDRRAILRADVIALPVELGRIVRREKDIEQLGVADLRRDRR